MDSENRKIPDLRWLPSYKSGADRIRSVLGIIANVLITVLVFLAAFLPLTYAWSLRKWNNLTINEILYHMNADTKGAGEEFIRSLIIESIIPSAIIAAAFVVLMIILKKKKRITLGRIAGGLAVLVSLIICVVTVASFWQEKGITDYLKSQASYGGFIDENYADPAAVTLTFPEQKRNLIYIFLESYENTFADESVGGAFSDNVMPELTQLSLDNENFSGGSDKLNGGVAMNGATWTMGAMFGQTSGLPLQISIDKNAMSSQDEFFPGITTLGDILADNGYRQVLLLGSDAEFGGRELYFTEHGNYEMKDYKYYTSNGTLPSDYYVWWGYEDKYLFENAKNELTQLAASDEPFNLTMLTVDTHFEDGYVCSLCGQEHGDRYSNVYSCSSRQVADFVSWIQQQPFYENTTIVISGDHLTMDSNYCSDVDDEYERTVYTTYINAPLQPESQEFRHYTTFDDFPTTLAALGVDIAGNRLGLGTNLFSAEQTLLEQYGMDEFNSGLLEKSELMEGQTSGITDKMADIEVAEYDPATQSIRVTVKNIIEVTGFHGIHGYLWKNADQSDRIELEGTGQSDGSYTFDLTFDRFNYEPGKYNFHVYEDSINIAQAFIGATVINYTDPENVNVYQADNGINCSEFNFETGHFTATYVPDEGEENLASVNIAVWAAEDQSDLRWYQTERQPDGTYTVDIDAFEHATDGTPFNVHAYIIGLDGQMQYKGGIEYTIQ